MPPSAAAAVDFPHGPNGYSNDSALEEGEEEVAAVRTCDNEEMEKDEVKGTGDTGPRGRAVIAEWCSTVAPAGQNQSFMILVVAVVTTHLILKHLCQGLCVTRHKTA